MLLKSNQMSFKWRYSPRNQQDKVLLLYIKQHPSLSVTEAILTALRSFWLPIAIADSTNYQTVDKQRIVRSCVNTLFRQAEVASEAVGLQLSRGGTIASFTPISQIKEPPLQEIQPSITALQLAEAAGSGDFDDSGLVRW